MRRIDTAGTLSGRQRIQRKAHRQVSISLLHLCIRLRHTLCQIASSHLRLRQDVPNVSVASISIMFDGDRVMNRISTSLLRLALTLSLISFILLGASQTLQFTSSPTHVRVTIAINTSAATAKMNSAAMVSQYRPQYSQRPAQPSHSRRTQGESPLDDFLGRSRAPEPTAELTVEILSERFHSHIRRV